jgi:hypothetical protein
MVHLVFAPRSPLFLLPQRHRLLSELMRLIIAPIADLCFVAAGADGRIYGAFNYCTSLASVSLPQAQTIGAFAFDNCTSLTSVSLPQAQTVGYWCV